MSCPLGLARETDRLRKNPLVLSLAGDIFILNISSFHIYAAPPAPLPRDEIRITAPGALFVLRASRADRAALC